jgi:hypothetical protein
MNNSLLKPLSEFTVQDLQLELIRRTRYNAFDGERVLRDLLAHRDRWEAVILDRQGGLDLIKLRDLSENHWNADTLYVLAVNEADARRIAQLAEDWLSEEPLVYSAEETQRALGGNASDEHRIVRFWWD